MVRNRSGWLVAVLALGLAGGACKKSEDKAATADKTAEPGKAGDKAADKTGTTPAAAAGDDLSLLPVDSELVMGLNFAQLQQSALWKQFSPKLMDKMSTKLADFKAACGFDPFDAVKTVSMGMKNLGGDKPEGAIVIHGPEKAKVMGCMDKMKAEAAKNGSTVSQDGDVTIVQDKNGEKTAFTFVNDNTVLGVIGANASKDSVMAAAKGGSALKQSQTFTEMYGKINTGDSLWLLMNGNSPAFNKMGAMGVKPKAVFGSVNVTDGLTVDMRLRLGTPDEATQLVTMMKGQINNPQVKQMFDKFDVAADASDVKFQIAMSNQKLQQLIGMVGGMMGGMMGGAGGAGGPPAGP